MSTLSSKPYSILQIHATDFIFFQVLFSPNIYVYGLGVSMSDVNILSLECQIHLIFKLLVMQLVLTWCMKF